MVEIPVLRFKPAEPVNLTEVLEAQARRLIEVGIPGEVGVNGGVFLDDAMGKINEFVWSPCLEKIGLDRVCVLHYAAYDRFLCEVIGASMDNNPDRFVLYRGVVVPRGLAVIQCQFGSAHRNTKSRYIRKNRNPLEELGIAKEGLSGVVHYGVDLLTENNMDFPGNRSRCGTVPYLCLCGNKPAMGGSFAGETSPNFGLVSRGSIRDS